MPSSKALEVNLATSYVDVIISDKYRVLQDVMQRYQGIMEALNTFLKEQCSLELKVIGIILTVQVIPL